MCADPDVVVALQDGDNINNIITVLPRDATDNAVRERLLSQAGLSRATAFVLPLRLSAQSIPANWSWLCSWCIAWAIVLGWFWCPAFMS
jgi:hypothetical protein